MIQVAIIGCGVIGPVHAAAVRLDAEARVRWAVDLDPAKAARMAADFSSTDASAAFSDPQVDLVCVCTQHPAHADLVLAALRAGKHVLCEKPLASTPADLLRIRAAAAAHPEQVASGVFQHRYAPLARRLRDLIAADAFGRIESLAVSFVCTRDQAYYASAPWRGRWDLEGGGVAINQGIHTIDLGLWISGLVVEQVTAEVTRRQLACIEVEDSFVAEAGCAGGAHASFRAINDGVTPWKQDIVIRGSRGAVVLGDNHRLVRIEHASRALVQELQALDGANLEGRPLGGGKDVYGYNHAVQIADVIECVRSGARPLISIHDAVPANQLVLAGYHSQATGAPAAVPLEPTAYRTPILTQRQEAHA